MYDRVLFFVFKKSNIMNLNESQNLCEYCLKPFNLYYIKCNECKSISLCVNCFSYGVQGGSHKKNHSYSIKMCKFVANVFRNSNWTWEDELKLITSIELYGIGNWIDIAEKVETHSPDECRDHYMKYYVKGPLGKYLLSGVSKKCTVLDHSVTYSETCASASLSPSLFEVMPPCSLTSDDQVILGYMPKRGDFERDYDNDAESILCRLKPDFVKDDLLNALKVAHVGIYTQRLKERQRRKFIAREHDLIGPIIACILNKRWKPPNAMDSNNSGVHFKSSTEKLPESDTSINTNNCVNNKPIISPDSKHRRQSKLSAQSVCSAVCRRPESAKPRSYDAFMINENMKPFLRYLTYSQGKALLENLHREEVLKFEISTIIDSIKKGRRRALEMPLRYPKSNIFMTTRPRLLGAVENGHSNGNEFENIAKDECPLLDFTNKQLKSSIKRRKRRKANSYFIIKRRRK